MFGGSWQEKGFIVSVLSRADFERNEEQDPLRSDLERAAKQMLHHEGSEGERANISVSIG